MPWRNRRIVYLLLGNGNGAERERVSVMSGISNISRPCYHEAWDNHVAALDEAHKKDVAESSMIP